MLDPIKIAELLSSYGGWGVAVLSIVGNVVLLKYIKGQHKERLKEKADSNNRSLTMLENKVEADLKHAQAFGGMKKIVEKLIEKLP